MLFGKSIDAEAQALSSASTSQLIPALFNNEVEAVSNNFQCTYIQRPLFSENSHLKKLR